MLTSKPSEPARLSPIDRLTRWRQTQVTKERYPAMRLTPTELLELGTIKDPVARLSRAREIISQRPAETS